MIASTCQVGRVVLRERWLVIGLLLFFAGIYVQYVCKIKHTDHGNRSAFLRWKVQLRDLDDGVDVWEKYAHPNPPMMALILKPFVQMPPLLGSSLWFWCKALLAIGSILAVVSMLDCPERPFPLWGKLLAIVLSLRPIEGDLVHGNVNLFILFLVVMALTAFCQRHEYLAGSLLGLSIACKLTPALFIAYFLWKRAWKTLLGTAAGMALFVLLIPSIPLGWCENLLYLQSWHAQMVAPYAAGVVTSEHKNQSLPGLLHRMLADEASFSDYAGDQKIVLDTHNFVSLDRAAVQGIVIGCAVLFALAAMRGCNTSTDLRPSWQLMAEFSVVIVGMLLFCERTWKHHCVTLLIPFSVLAYIVSTPTFARCVRWHVAATLAVVAILMFATSTGHWDVEMDAQARFGKLAQVYGAYVWVFLVLLICTLVLLHKKGRSHHPRLTKEPK